MSDFAKAFNLTIPANTPIATPVSLATPLGLCVVTDILVTFPPGCADLVGVAVQAGLSNAYPVVAGQWLVFDDYTYEQEVTGQINSGQWGLIGYNLDTFQHIINIVYKANYWVQSPGLGFSPLVSV